MLDPKRARELHHATADAVKQEEDRKRKEYAEKLARHPYEMMQKALDSLPSLIEEAAKRGQTRITLLNSSRGYSRAMPALTEMEPWFELTYNELIQAGYEPFVSTGTSTSYERDSDNGHIIGETYHTYHTLQIELDPVKSKESVLRWKVQRPDVRPEDVAALDALFPEEALRRAQQAEDGRAAAAQKAKAEAAARMWSRVLRVWICVGGGAFILSCIVSCGLVFLGAGKTPLPLAASSGRANPAASGGPWLTQAELEGKSKWDLTVMANEPYARHGIKFGQGETNAALRAHFSKFPWY